jgi:hypothetical protein
MARVSTQYQIIDVTRARAARAANAANQLFVDDSAPQQKQHALDRAAVRINNCLQACHLTAFHHRSHA